MTDNLSDVEAFGAKLNADHANLEDAISEQIDAMDASGGEPPESLESVFSVPKTEPGYKKRIKSTYRRPSYEAPPVTEAPEGTPQPLATATDGNVVNTGFFGETFFEQGADKAIVTYF